MKTKKYAEETEGYKLEDKNEFDVTYVTEAETDAIQHASKQMLEAVLQSGMRFIKTLREEEEGVERIYMDAEDASASVVANVVSDLRKSDFDYDISGTMQSMDIVAVSYNFEPVKQEPETEEVETDE